MQNSDSPKFSSRISREPTESEEEDDNDDNWGVYPFKPVSQQAWDDKVTIAAVAAAEVEVDIDSTLTGEFEYTSADYGTIGGFSKDGKISSLHAGMNCFFR